MSSNDSAGDLQADFISPAIFLLKNYVKQKNNIVNSIHPLSNPVSQLKSEALTLLRNFDMIVRELESQIKPLNKKILGNLNLMAQEQRKTEQSLQEPPQLTPLTQSTCPAPAVATVVPKKTKTLPNIPLTTPRINGNPISHSTCYTNRISNSQSEETTCTCPFCHRRDCRPALNNHVRDEHPDEFEVYDKIASLTPEFMLASDAAVGGNRQCWYCNAPFRSNAPLFRHISEKHVDYFDIFIKISQLRGDNIQSVKCSTLNLTKYPTLQCAMSSPKNARKSIQCSPSKQVSVSHTKPTYQIPLPVTATAPISLETNESPHSARRRRELMNPDLPQPYKRNRRSRYLVDPNSTCEKCHGLFRSPDELKVHSVHCSAKTRDSVDGPVADNPVGSAGGGMMQSEIRSSSVVSSSSYDLSNGPSDRDSVNPSDDELSTHNSSGQNIVNLPPEDQRRLVRTVRKVTVCLPTIVQEDLVACMQSSAFRQLQKTNII